MLLVVSNLGDVWFLVLGTVLDEKTPILTLVSVFSITGMCSFAKIYMLSFGHLGDVCWEWCEMRKHLC